MSHTTTISTLLLADVECIRAAIAELKGQGVDVDLLENAIPRAYYQGGQEGMDTAAPFVIKCNDGPYDVGLYESPSQPGQYEARADFYLGHIERQLGVTPGEGDNREQAKLGKFYQAYAANLVERQAARQGHSVRRVASDSGNVQLVIGVA